MRLPEWEQRLGDYLAEVRDTPFAYGVHDCALHGGNVVLAITGVDHAEPFRARYATALGAARALRTIGAGSLEATFDSHLQEKPVAFAARGDLVMAGDAIGVCIGGDALFVGQEGQFDGLVRLPRSAWTKAWKV